MPGDQTFVVDNYGWKVTPDLRTVCVGPIVKTDTTDTPQDTPQAISDGVEPVTPPTPSSKPLPADMLQGFDTTATAIKDGLNRGLSTRAIAKELNGQGIEISHMTVARRIKDLQGVLL